ncbi:conserved exported hypothetical protein [Verrucomicrobia bacterium]|nr:conserved exported hypothetical protein [Verrucomicrobiota bacterium]
MKRINCLSNLLLSASLCLAMRGLAAAPEPQAPLEGSLSSGKHLWKPVADEVYLQEIGEQIPTDQPTTCVAVYGKTLYAVVGGVLKEFGEGVLHDSPGAPKGVRRLRSLGDALWAAAPEGVFRFTGSGWERVDTRPFIDLCLNLGQVCGATRDELFRFEKGRFVSLRPPSGYLSSDTTLMREDSTQVLTDPVQIGPVDRIASYSGTLYLLRPGGLALMEGSAFVPDPVDWGALPSPVTRDMLGQGSRLYIATDRGVAVLRGMAMTTLRGEDGLPYEDTTCLAQGLDGDLWIGTTAGAIRHTGEEFHYLGAHHWLPGDYVRDIAVGQRVAYIATDAGLGIIRYEPFTLSKKAAWFERELEQWGMKRLGFVHKLYWGGDQEGWLREISDNDGGNTAHYLAAMTFKYAVTGDEQARQEASEAFKAMLWLGEITQKPGFIARAIWSVKGDKGERATQGSGGLPAKWYPTADGLWFWKGDTSSDEVNAHMYAVSLFYELAAKGPEKELARQHIAKIASYIMDNGWVLRDLDGKPTRWGRWDPDYLLRPYGFESRGLNGMEAQTYMHTAYALTGDAKYQRGLEQLLKWRYHTYTVRQRLTFPPDAVAPWDDELAFFCYHPLLRYAKDPELRSIYLRSLERTWAILRRHQLPFFNFSYGALTDNDCEAPQAVEHLREWSLDLVNHNYRNSHRSDLAPQRGYVPYSGGTRAISPRESEAKWGDRSPLQYDGGENGKAVTPPIGWLEDYWMGRYFGFIEPPKNPALAEASLPERVITQRGATPYAGPPRPARPADQQR